MRRFFSEKQVISKKKKKKGLRRNPKAFSGRNRKFKRFFQPRTGDLQKKRSSPKSEGFFRNFFFSKFFEIGNSSGFSGQKQVISKKKGLRRNPKAFSGRNQKFKRFFHPKPVNFSSHKPALKSRWGDA